MSKNKKRRQLQSVLKKQKKQLLKKQKRNTQRKQFQNHQKCKTRSWSIPQPEEYTFDGRGYKNLYHFTVKSHIPTILKYGIIFGDVCVSQYEGFNAPNLTTENQYHNPASNPYLDDEDKHDTHSYYRLTIKCPKDADKLINYGWFDKTYCKGFNYKVVSKDKIRGNLDKQYIYLGHIIPSMITEIKVWNKETQYWDRPRNKETDDLYLEYENLPYSHKHHYGMDQLRMGGLRLNDYTGMVKQFYAENDHKDIWKDIYVLSDYIIDFYITHRVQVKGQGGSALLHFTKNVLHGLRGGDTESVNSVIYGVVHTYNQIVDKSHQINPTDFGKKLKKKIKEFDEWLDEQNEEPVKDVPPLELKRVA